MDQKELGKLKYAILHGQKDIAELLLRMNTPVNNLAHPGIDFRAPLHSAVYLGNLEIVKKLLNEGASINAFNVNSETALTLAAKFGEHKIVDLLLSNGDLINCMNSENFTHFRIACMRNRVDVVEKFVEDNVGFNVSVKSESIR
ncbi:hypothetical protein QAD02_018777 [Eretmocerus hayati]|uniref:Uncharacterized protein n=1 Tax=Eretmocerus hayati TaxID=131215 RepID=A0ACC2PHT3_9HYME|nr:hypothetical protein QAD02_018777 [Eretmocerus hayati]